MEKKHPVIQAVYAAKSDIRKADDLIRDYIPFIRSEVSKFLFRLCTEQDDEFSIAMIAFHEAIQGYEHGRGAFLSCAAMLIRSRLIDYQRRRPGTRATSPSKARGRRMNCCAPKSFPWPNWLPAPGWNERRWSATGTTSWSCS